MGRKTKVALTVGAAGIAAWAASKAIVKPIPRVGKKALEFDTTIILANRGGLLEAPENTNAAFSKSAALGVHGFAIDIRLTKDEEILVFHDEYADRTTDLAGKISDFTLSELKNADAGYRFKSEKGEYSYRGKGEQLLSLRELLNQFTHMFMNINLKDSPETYEGSLMPSKLWRLIEELGAEDRIVITSAYDEQIDRFNLYAQNRVATGAGEDEVKKAYAAFTSQFGHLYNPRADLFRIPEKLGVFPLGTEGFIKFLLQLNIPTYYENVNNRDSMIQLINAGAAGLITDCPTFAMEIIQGNLAE
ncbi:glycerophosphodiester phosphodiesterase family protein [Sporosarcina sp. G11-34]|uniref:glycerophosphodiester phosphodiesterase family protein n=1 Tax=Sporosarcina sp. G11-34 TaxID=2849605 RepID=UPI0022A93C9C|nr:glycerophosphodiester phosphodiesterase family protein [Sporosarcina sp. G11-34]MCZ2258896.1 glycerophosphodiester phosphodiesterase [Sporosarcina sp. G11-34]